MSLYNHLCADQDIRLMQGKRTEDLPVIILSPCGIRIHAQNPCLRKPAFQLTFHLLGSHAESADKRRTAVRAHPDRLRLIAAVVAYKFPIVVKRERNIAVRAPDDLSAGPAGQKTGNSPPVQEKNALLLFPESFLQFLLQPDTDYRPVAALKLLPHIHNFHRRKICPAVAAVQDKPGELSFPAPVPRVYRRCRGTEYHVRLFHTRTFQRSLPRVIAGRLFRPVTRLMFLVDQDQSGVRKRGE